VQVQVLLPAVKQEKSGRQDLNLFKLLLPAVEQGQNAEHGVELWEFAGVSVNRNRIRKAIYEEVYFVYGFFDAVLRCSDNKSARYLYKGRN
jgi:hypothetical protein